MLLSEWQHVIAIHANGARRTGSGGGWSRQQGDDTGGSECAVHRLTS